MNKRKTLWVLLVLMLVSAGAPARARQIQHISGPKSRPGPSREDTLSRHLIMADAGLNRDTPLTGLSYHFTVLPDLGLGLAVGGALRWRDFYARERIRPHYFIQREENSRFLLYGAAEQVFQASETAGIYAQLGAGYTWGDFSGTTRDPEYGWTPLAGLGLQVAWLGRPDVVGRIGYQYADYALHPQNWITLSVGVGP